ncbi:MAG: prepilin-type N-terminal cleavage/methylation domain-containing protein [Lachnospiraceae bacterium]|nr:prepilin-type N-terminal cleavage/methylation domain-containing protein [Lachnospiraceae bacterium]
MNKKEMNNKGFSLVELIIVIAIMAILVGVLAPQFIKYVDKSRASTDIQNIQQYKTAVEVYVADKEGVATDPTIVVSKSAKTITVSPADVATNSGLAATTTLKSGNWTSDITFTYNHSTYTWGTGSVTTDTHTTFTDMDLVKIIK